MYITTRQKKRIIFTTGTIAGGLVVLLLLTFLISNVANWLEKDPTPRNVLVSNVNRDSASISWVTEKKAVGTISVVQGRRNIGGFSDLRNTSKTRTHYFNIDSLKPETDYLVEVFVDGEKYLEETFTTAPVIGNPPPSHVISGKVEGVKGDALVFFISDEVNSAPLSTYISENGDWFLNVSGLRSSDLQNYLRLTRGSDSRIRVLFFSPFGSKIVRGNNNVVFGRDGVMDTVRLDEDVDVFSSMAERTSLSDYVMGVSDEVVEEERPSRRRRSEPQDQIEVDRDRLVEWGTIGDGLDKLDDYGIN